MKRNFIRLIKEMKDDKPVYETFLTPTFISFRKMYEAADVKDSVENNENQDERQAMDEMLDMVVSIYEGQFTRDQLIDGLHSPDAITILNEQIDWVATGKMNEEAKKELAKMV